MRSVVRKLGLHTALGFAAISCMTHACTQAGDDPSVTTEIGAQDPELTFEPAALPRGTRRTLIDGITGAENQLFTSTGRLFVSGDEGIYEILANATGGYESRPLHTGEACAFGGLTEQAGVIYANCYDFTDSTLFAARLTDQPEFRAIYHLPGIALANGLTNDDAGALFVASSFDGQIIRLLVTATDPLTIEAEDTFEPNSGLITNGIKYFDQKLYWTAFTNLNVEPVTARGTSGSARTIGGALTLFDDLYVDANSILVADYLNSSVVACDLSGKVLASTPNATFDGPSSVLPAKGRVGLPDSALVVTERGGNRVSVFEP